MYNPSFDQDVPLIKNGKAFIRPSFFDKDMLTGFIEVCGISLKMKKS